MRAAMAHAEPRLIDRLPKVRGRLTEGSLLSAVTWFRVGGPAEVLFKPADVADLALFLKAKPGDVPVTVKECQFCHTEPLVMFSPEQQKQFREQGGFIITLST